MKTPRSFLAVLLLLIPSAVYLWYFSDIPQFGYFKDDGLYYASAKSLAEGGGYRIESLPGEPAQTKFPPLYPLLLSIAWRIDPQFPRNLHIAAWISWLALPAMLVLALAYFPKLGVSGWRAWLLLCLMAVNPQVLSYGSQLMSELLFLALILAAMLLVERCVDGDAGIALAIAAGAVAGLAYLTRSAGIAMLPAAVVYFALRGKWRTGAWFAAAMAPFIAGWMLWARLHQVQPADSTLMFYTDYLGIEIYTLRHVSLHMLLWKNVESFIWGLGSLIQPKFTMSQVLMILASAIGVAMISGIVRMVRRGHGVLYALFAAGSVLILVVWCYPPDERFLLPLFPLALAGLFIEMEHLAGMVRAGLRHRDWSQRIVAGALAAAAVVVLAGSVILQIYISFGFPEVAREQRLENANRMATYRWIAANLPADANLLAGTDAPLRFGQDDPLLFLYTGRHAINDEPPLAFWYQDESSRILDWISNPLPLARAHGLRYLVFTGSDAEQQQFLKNADYKVLYRSDPITVYALPQ
jgi:4-amino-4-deoxy-L-arabinose transferase-like glycosyltransferase